MKPLPSDPIDVEVDNLIPTNPRQMLHELIDRVYSQTQRRPRRILASPSFRSLLEADMEFQYCLTITTANDLIFNDRIIFEDTPVIFKLNARHPTLIAA